jgi:hypothetical protein
MEICRILDITYNVIYAVNLGKFTSDNSFYDSQVSVRTHIEPSPMQSISSLYNSIGHTVCVARPTNFKPGILVFNDAEVVTDGKRVLSCRIRLMEYPAKISVETKYTVNITSAYKYNVRVEILE